MWNQHHTSVAGACTLQAGAIWSRSTAAAQPFNMVNIPLVRATCLPSALQVSFMRNKTGKVVYDRRFNTTALLASYYGSNVDFAGRISWDPQV